MIMMANRQLAFAWAEVNNYTDRDAYISDLALSPIFYDGDEVTEAPVDMEIVAQLQQIWDVCHMTISDIRKATGLSQRQFGDSLLIPYRTIQNWENRECCPNYTRLMIARCVGLIK